MNLEYDKLWKPTWQWFNKWQITQWLLKFASHPFKCCHSRRLNEHFHAAPTRCEAFILRCSATLKNFRFSWKMRCITSWRSIVLPWKSKSTIFSFYVSFCTFYDTPDRKFFISDTKHTEYIVVLEHQKE